MDNHESARPLALTKELWASLIQNIRSGLMIAQRRTPDKDERKEAEAAVEALETVESLTPEPCLNCAIRDMLIAHAEAYAQSMMDSARGDGWNPSDPAHVSAQTLILRARLVALGTVAGELAAAHRPYSDTPWPILIAATSDCLLKAFSGALNAEPSPEQPAEPARPKEPKQPSGSVMSDFMDGLRPPKNRLH